MNHHNIDQLLLTSTTSPDASNLNDSGPSSLNPVSCLEQSVSPIFDIATNSEYGNGYYGFRTRHLSCIEENESDSFNSLASDFIEEPTDQFSTNEAEKPQWGSEDFNYVESMNDSCNSGLYQSFKNNVDNQNPLGLEYASAVLEVKSGSCSPYREFANGLMCKYPDVMTNSCYGALNQSFKSDATRLPKAEPIYAVIDKEIQQKNQMKKIMESSCSSTQANGAAGNSDELRTSIREDTGRSVYADCTEIDISQHYEIPQAVTSTCPSCHLQFDKDKRRKLIDSCGHERCYSCMFESGKCPFCITNGHSTIEPMINPPDSKADMFRSHESCRLYESVRYSSPEQQKNEFTKIGTEASLQAMPIADNEQPTDPNSSPKRTSQHSTPSTTPRKKNFTAKGLRRTFGGHRRTSSQGSVEVPTSLSDCSVMDSSFHSDSVITKPNKHAAHHYNTGKSNGIHFSRAAYAGHLSSFVFGKIKSLWNAQSNNAGLNQLADVKVETKDENLLSKSEATKATPNVENSKNTSNCDKTSKKPNQKISQRFSTNLRTIKDWSARKIPKPLLQDSTNEKEDSIQESTYNSMKSALQYLALKPLFFEVPLQEPDPPFVGRQWIIRDMSNILTTDMPGVLITGKSGSGKTSLILQLVDYSCFGRKKGSQQAESGGIYCQINVSHDRIKSLASQVVAYHFCQMENRSTCLVPDFVHSLAAQLCQAPQLVAYREYLLNEADLQNILSISECVANPEQVMLKGILEPLAFLKTSGKINVKQCLLLIDALCEAESHQPDYGFTISSFLIKMVSHFPPWFKVVATIRSQVLDAVKGLPYMRLSLDNWESNENVQKDINEYILQRIKHSLGADNGLPLGQDTFSNEAFFEQLTYTAKGSFLHAKLTLDLVEKGQLIIRSPNLKVLPTSLSQLFLLNFNFRFPTNSSYEKVSPILSVCLAALSPLTLSEIYYSIVALNVHDPLDWNEFMQRFRLLEDLLVKRIDNTYMFFHPSFREWLKCRANEEPTKFLVDFRKGHYAIAFRLSRLQAPLDTEQTLELAYHIIKARVYRCLQPAQHTLRDIQAYWVASVSNSVSNAFSTLRNVYNPDIKVCKLLLLAGANPNIPTDFLKRSPILCIAAYEGMTSLVSVLLEFGADVEKQNTEGHTPLILASMRGHTDIARLLVAGNSSLGKYDNNKQCALVHAAKCGQSNVLHYLLKCDWKSETTKKGHSTFQEAVTQSLLEVATQKSLDIIEELLDASEICIDACDPLTGDTALMKAAKLGHSETVSLLLFKGAEIDKRNKEYQSAIILAARAGHSNVVEILLERQSNVNQFEVDTRKTPLIIAAEEGHLNVVKNLVENGAQVEHKDINGLTALSWACLQGRYHVAKYLLEKGAQVETNDDFKRTPLDFASYQGPLRLIQLLLNNGAVVERMDENGVSPLDRAVACRNIPVLQIFLKSGALLRPTTWTLAEEAPEIFLLFLNNVVRDGNSLLKRHLLPEASQKFRLALNKISTIEHSSTSNPEVITQLLYNLLLSLARCQRKMNDVQDAIKLATRAIGLIPVKYEGYYVRARIYFVLGDYEAAFKDINAALEKAENVSLYIKDILERTKSDIENRLRARHSIIKETTDL